jgi:hypothetical protein
VGHPHRVGPTAALPIEIGSANNLPWRLRDRATSIRKISVG